jgi:hypothetical protein
MLVYKMSMIICHAEAFSCVGSTNTCIGVSLDCDDADWPKVGHTWHSIFPPRSLFYFTEMSLLVYKISRRNRLDVCLHGSVAVGPNLLTTEGWGGDFAPHFLAAVMTIHFHFRVFVESRFRDLKGKLFVLGVELFGAVI